jgi:ABC-2 type transport system permease protein
MRKIWVVACREYNAAVRTKAFIISLLIMPLLMGGSALVQFLLKDVRDTKDKRFAVVDLSTAKRYLRALQNAVKEHNETQGPPRFILVEREPADSTDDAVNDLRVTLSDEVRAGKLDGVIEIGAHVAEPPEGNAKAGRQVRYQSNRLTYREFPDFVAHALTPALQEARAEARQEHVAVEKLRPIFDPVPMKVTGLSERDSAEGDERTLYALFFVPMAMMILMFMVVMMGSTPLMQGVVEEKMQRIAEVLLGSLSPFELMLGKLIGMTGVSLTIASVYLGGLVWAANQFPFIPHVSPGLLAWFMLFQALAGLMYGSLFAAIGAACTDMKETQNLLWPVMLLATSPLFILGSVIQEPNSSVATGLSFFPFATPTLMIARLAVPPGVPWWQPAVGAVLCLLTTLFCIWAAGRIFRVGLLMQGKGARPGEILRWVFRG